MGKIQLMGSRNLRRRETALHSELEALQWAMESMIQYSTCQSYFPRTQNEIADSLSRNGCSFHRSLCFIGCSIPVLLPDHLKFE
uniref:RNase H type-1 domain-containing protein n=1 Tax=Brassica oleracea TaxID=3712 RepID=A0A3P6EYK9_BRAOL|nr:unnamed protein product [Brassica oleracea]